jgi:hypothetical protein
VALAASRPHIESLGKTQLQKFIYLLDALAPVFAIHSRGTGYRTYKHGPWDPAIQNAVDSLVFLGLATATNIQELQNGVAARYELTNAGRGIWETLQRDARFDDRIRCATLIALNVSRIGWHRLTQLVYAEPTFVATKVRGYGHGLAPGNAYRDSTRELAFLIAESLELRTPDTRAAERAIAEAFFRFLDAYSNPDRYEQPAEGLRRWI